MLILQLNIAAAMKGRDTTLCTRTIKVEENYRLTPQSSFLHPGFVSVLVNIADKDCLVLTSTFRPVLFSKYKWLFWRVVDLRSLTRTLLIESEMISLIGNRHNKLFN